MNRVKTMMKIKMNTNSVYLMHSDYTPEQEGDIYDQQLQDVVDHIREYLDQLDYLPEYRVRWKNYNSTIPTIPKRFVKVKPL